MGNDTVDQRTAEQGLYPYLRYIRKRLGRLAKALSEGLLDKYVEREVYDRRNAEMYAENERLEELTDRQSKHITDVAYENERLRAELALAKANASTATNTVLAVNFVLRADIARLNERNAANEREIERLTKMLEASRRSNALLQLDPLAKEIERPRAALETVRGHKHCGPCDRTCTEWLSDIAREALRPADETSVRRCICCGATEGFTSPLNVCQRCEALAEGRDVEVTPFAPKEGS